MSAELHIFIHGARVPSRESWQAEIDRMGLPVTLDAELDLQRNVGCTPVAYRGDATGFELSLDSAGDVLPAYDAYREAAGRIGARDKSVTFRLGSCLTEWAAALSAAVALVQIAGGVYFDLADDVLYDGADAVDSLRRELSALLP